MASITFGRIYVQPMANIAVIDQPVKGPHTFSWWIGYGDFDLDSIDMTVSYNAKVFFTLCTVDWDTPVMSAVCLTDSPDRRHLMTALYSTANCALSFTPLPLGFPGFPPSRSHLSRPDLNLDCMASNSALAANDRQEMKMFRKGFGLPSDWKIWRFSFWK